MQVKLQLQVDENVLMLCEPGSYNYLLNKPKPKFQLVFRDRHDMQIFAVRLLLAMGVRCRLDFNLDKIKEMIGDGWKSEND